MLVAGVGMIFIVSAKLLGLYQWQVTVVPALVMLCYAGAILLPFMRLRDDQSGDNLYYLGFLYTLASIGASLYQFATAGGQTQIVTNFGVAITTTVIGLALRVAFNQMRTDPADVERSARLELADAARRLRHEVDEAVLEFNHFRRAAVQSGTEGHTALKEMMETTASAFSKLTEEYSKREIDHAKEQKGLAEVVESMAADAKKIGRLVKNVTTQLEKISGPDYIVQVNFAPALEKLDATVESIHSMQQAQANQLTGLLETSVALSEAAHDVAERIAMLLDHLERPEQPMQRQIRGG